MKKNTSSLCQITFPFCVLGIAALGLLTSMYLTNGSYVFRLNATKDGLKIETGVDKRDMRDDTHLP